MFFLFFYVIIKLDIFLCFKDIFCSLSENIFCSSDLILLYFDLNYFIFTILFYIFISFFIRLLIRGTSRPASTSLIKNCLSENEATFEFEELIPEYYRRDQPAQRLCHNPFEKRLDRKTKQRSGRRDQMVQRPRLYDYRSTIVAQPLSKKA